MDIQNTKPTSRRIFFGVTASFIIAVAITWFTVTKHSEEIDSIVPPVDEFLASVNERLIEAKENQYQRPDIRLHDGWSANGGLMDVEGEQLVKLVVLMLFGKDGKPLVGATVEVNISNVDDPSQWIETKLPESYPGYYARKIEFSEFGSWRLSFAGGKDQEVIRYQVTKTLKEKETSSPEGNTVP